ncbi:MAG: hypothetical protein CK424_05610 [Legionella sp.]|nr:MAG: hypothetical protein CK424_05610 [Legionella sp.]
MTLTMIHLDPLVPQLQRFLEAKQKLQFVDQTLSTLPQDTDLKKFLKFAQIEYMKKVAIELQLYKLVIREHYSTLETPLPFNIIDELVELPNNIDPNLCVSEIKTTFEISRTLSAQSVFFEQNYNFLYKKHTQFYMSMMHYWNNINPFNRLYQYPYIARIWENTNLLLLLFNHLSWLISLGASFAFVGMLLLDIILISALITFVFPHYVWHLVGLMGLASALSKKSPCFDFPIYDFHQMALPTMDAIVIDFGSIEQLQYASIDLQEKYARGLQSIGLVKNIFIKDFESSPIMRHHPNVVLTLLKSQLTIKDILAFIVTLPPGVVSDQVLNQLISNILTLYHGENAIQKLQDAVDTYEATNSAEHFSLACIHRSGLFGIQQNHTKAVQSFKKIKCNDSNYVDTKIELSHMMLPAKQEAMNDCNIANRLAQTPSEKTLTNDLRNIILDLKDEESSHPNTPTMTRH